MSAASSKPAETDLQGRALALKETVRAYNPEADLEKLQRGFEMGLMAHEGQTRKSGEPYFTHSMSVAESLAELRMDVDTIIAGMLHDVAEDTEVSVEEIRESFGEDVALLVDGVTKIEEIAHENAEARQAATYRKLLLTLAKDVRVILIKLADRLHNMGTLGALREERRAAIAEETLNVYAPLAHRFGIAKIKWELEDLAFKHLHPEEYRKLVAGISARREEREATLHDFQSELRLILAKAEIQAEVAGRPKHFWSIYKKMLDRDTTLDKIYDLLAVRVVVPDVGDCYRTLGMVHEHFPHLHERLKDYISNPKQNLYQSLHTTVKAKSGELVEVQIRTVDMHRRAELGVAAHWTYKEGSHVGGAEAEFEVALQRFREILEMQQDVEDPREFMESLKIDVFEDEVYVFTPRGDIVKMPQGSTALDFAFYVHSQVGLHCVGARINERMVPLREPLESGQTVEVMTRPSAHPSFGWLEIVKTSRAKHRIRQWLKNSQFEEAVKLGREMVERELIRRKLHIDDLDKRLDEIGDGLGQSEANRLLASVGNGDMPLQKVVNRLVPPERKRRLALPDRLQRALRGRNNQSAVRIQGLDNLLIRFARCCQPVPGDEIKGIVTVGRGVSVHRGDCKNLRNGKIPSDRLLEVTWDVAEQATFPVQMTVTGRDRMNLLADLSRCISDLGSNIQAGSFEGAHEYARCTFVVEVRDITHLDHMMRAIRKLPGVSQVERSMHSVDPEA